MRVADFGSQSMVSPGVLQNPEVKRWLAGVEPAWTLLDVTTCKHPGTGSQSSEGRARIDCNWVSGLRSQSLQMGSKSLQTGSQTSASCPRSLQMRPGNKTTGFLTDSGIGRTVPGRPANSPLLPQADHAPYFDFRIVQSVRHP